MVSGTVSALRPQRVELSSLFDHIATQLEYFHSYVEYSSADVTVSRNNRETFENQVTAGVEGTRDTVLKEADVDAMRIRIRDKLNNIGEVMVRFRASESKRSTATEQRNDELIKRVSDLEFEAQALKQRCDDQHSKLLLDRLTQVHGRYEYDSRIAEEFDRWGRYQSRLSYAI